jgi:hypothetical protein
MAHTVKTTGQNRVHPSVYLMPTAHTTSNKPAMKSMIQDIELWIQNAPLQKQIGAIIKFSNLVLTISDLCNEPKIEYSCFKQASENTNYLFSQRESEFGHIGEVELPFFGTNVFTGKKVVANSK